MIIGAFRIHLHKNAGATTVALFDNQTGEEIGQTDVATQDVMYARDLDVYVDDTRTPVTP